MNMPKFIQIIGPQAVGKMTVGQELAKITGYKLLYNHMTIEMVRLIFDYDKEAFRKMNSIIRYEIFKEFSKSNEKGIIFTGCFDFGNNFEKEKAETDFRKEKIDTLYAGIYKNCGNLEFLQTKISELKIQSEQEEQFAKQIKKDLADLEEKIVSGGNLEIKENSLVVRLQQIQKIEDQQKRYQDLEKKAESKKKAYLTASQKRAEIKEILNNYELLSLKEVGCNIEIEEDADTFEGNSLKKAKEISKITNMPCIADDSGLCIDIFDGWPGIYTARFLGENSTPEQRNTAILEKMKDLKEEDRKARVRCVITYYDNGEIIVGKGEIEGKITKKPRGENGFGFDPIFELENGKTMAELTKEEKNLISHRKKALENLKKQLTTK